MRAGRCTSALLSPLSAVILALSCTPAMEPVGISSSAAPPPPASASVKVPTWDRAASLKDMKGWTRANPRRFPSSGHFFGKYDADVMVNDLARDGYANVAPGSSLPVGALIAQVLITRDGTPGPVLAMEKGASGWTFIELDSELHVQRRGRLSPCVECHTHVASQDELFGVPVTGK